MLFFKSWRLAALLFHVWGCGFASAGLGRPLWWKETGSWKLMWNVRNWPVWYRGAPSSLTNSGRSEALVWRPWINKPWGMTMRRAHICHHAALGPAPSSSPPLPCPPSHLHPSSLSLFSFILPSASSSPLPQFSRLPSGSIHPLLHPCMAVCPSVCPGVLPVLLRRRNCSATEALHAAAETPAFRPETFIYLSKRDGQRFSMGSTQVQSHSDLDLRTLK